MDRYVIAFRLLEKVNEAFEKVSNNSNTTSDTNTLSDTD